MQLTFEYPENEKKQETPKQRNRFPKDWKVDTIIKCCEYVDYRGKTPPKSSTGVFLVTARNVKKGFIDYGESQEFISPDLYDAVMQRGTPKEGDILITTEAPLGNVAQVDQEEIALAQRIIKYRPRRGSIIASYLMYYFLSSYFQDLLDAHSSGSTAKGIKGQVLHQLPVVIPPIEEQKAIAKALSDVDALINSLDQLIAKKRDIKQGAMQELLTGKTRLPGFTKQWTTNRIGELLAVRHGKSQHDVASRNGIYPILATGGEIGRSKEYLYNKPSVLIGRKGTINAPQYIDTPFWTIDTLFYTEIKESVVPRFMYYVFKMIDWHSYNEASGVPSLNASTIEAIEVQIPLKPEQEAIAQVLSDMDAEIQALEARRDKTKRLKQGMMQELLTGRTRLL